MVSYAQAFGRSLTTSDHSLLRALRAGARQTPPADFLTWYCNSHAIGTMQERHAQWLAARLGNCNYQAQGLVWHAGQVDAERRSHQLQAALACFIWATFAKPASTSPPPPSLKGVT